MKKLLLGTTTLLAASVLSAQAFAGGETTTNGAFDLKISGAGTFLVQYKSRESTKDDTISYRNHNMKTSSSIAFKGSKTFDSGTSAGFEIGLTTATAVTATDHIWVKGSFGNFYLGDRDSEELEVSLSRNYSGVGLLAKSIGANEAAITSSADTRGASNTKVSYVSNAMSGFTFAINYTPDLVKDSAANTVNTDAGGVGEDLLVGLKWVGDMGGATTSLSFGYGVAKAEDNSGDKDVDDDTRTRIGFSVTGIGNLTVGGYWMSHADDSVAVTPTEGETSMGIGGKWVSGDWTVGIGWETSSHDELTEAATNTADGTDKATRVDAGVAYKLNADMTVKLGYRQENYQDDQNLAADENNTKSLDVKFVWAVAPGLAVDLGLQSFSYTHHLGLATSAKKTGTAAFVQTKVTF